jgi:hypothetical protein
MQRSLKMLFAGFLLIALAAALVVACGSSSSSSSKPGTDSGTSDATQDSSVPSDASDTGARDTGTMDATEEPDGCSAGLTCFKLLLCDQPCSTSACTNACFAEATAVAQGLFDELTNCLNANCSSADGGPCASPNSAACNACETQMTTGACISNLSACEQDMHKGCANGDAGAVLPTMDAGATYNCGELNTCLAGCTGDAGACTAACNAQATPEAKALEAALQGCLAMACPSTDGGPCTTEGTACMACIEEVTLAEPDTCATPYITCNMDKSNEPDGGAGVQTFVDGGVVATVLTGLDQAASTIVAGGGYLYFTQVVGGGPVYRLPIGDGGAPLVDGGDAGVSFLDASPPVQTLGPPQPTPVSLALDANNVYVWSVGTFNLGSEVNNHDGTVVQVPLDGGAAITLGTGLEVIYDAAYLNAVAVDSKYVYWVEGAVGSDGQIMRAPIGGGSPAMPIYTGRQIPQAVASDGMNVYWAEWGTFSDAGLSNNNGALFQGPIAGGATPHQLASGQPAPSAIAIDPISGNVFWVNLGVLAGDNFPALNTGSVWKVPIGGSSATATPVATGQAVPVSVVVSGGTVYWSQYAISSPGLIMSASTTQAGTAAPLVAGLYDPAALAIAGNTIYWTCANSSPTNGYIQALTPR